MLLRRMAIRVAFRVTGMRWMPFVLFILHLSYANPSPLQPSEANSRTSLPFGTQHVRSRGTPKDVRAALPAQMSYTNHPAYGRTLGAGVLP